MLTAYKNTDISTESVVQATQDLPPFLHPQGEIHDLKRKIRTKPNLLIVPQQDQVRIAAKAQPTSTVLVMVRGLPGSGKGMVAKALTMVGYLLFEANMYFYENGRHRYDATRIEEAHAWCRKETRAALGRGENVVVCNTFTRLSEMEAYLEMGAGIIRVFEARAPENVHWVPPPVLTSMAARWEQIPVAGKFSSLQIFKG